MQDRPRPIPRGVVTPVPVTNQAQRAATANPLRTKFYVQNLSVSPVEIGYDGGLQYGRGFQIPAGGTYFDDVGAYRGEWWIIAGVAGPLDCRIGDEVS